MACSIAHCSASCFWGSSFDCFDGPLTVYRWYIGIRAWHTWKKIYMYRVAQIDGSVTIPHVLFSFKFTISIGQGEDNCKVSEFSLTYYTVKFTTIQYTPQPEEKIYISREAQIEKSVTIPHAQFSLFTFKCIISIRRGRDNCKMSGFSLISHTVKFTTIQ